MERTGIPAGKMSAIVSGHGFKAAEAALTPRFDAGWRGREFPRRIDIP